MRIWLWSLNRTHQSMSAKEMLYFTVAYDWMLFGHWWLDRRRRGECIFEFCFEMVGLLADDVRKSAAGPTNLKSDHERGREKPGTSSPKTSKFVIEIPQMSSFVLLPPSQQVSPNQSFSDLPTVRPNPLEPKECPDECIQPTIQVDDAHRDKGKDSRKRALSVLSTQSTKSWQVLTTPTPDSVFVEPPLQYPRMDPHSETIPDGDWSRKQQYERLKSLYDEYCHCYPDLADGPGTLMTDVRKEGGPTNASGTSVWDWVGNWGF